MRRALTTACTLTALALAAPAAAPAQTPPPAPEERIRAGVAVASVDVGTLTVPEAQAKLEQTLGPVLTQDLVVAVAGRRFTLRGKALGLELQALKSAQRARQAGAAAPPGPDGTVAPLAVPPAVAYERGAIRAFVAATARRVAVAPRDARLRITAGKLVRRHSREGRALDAKALRAAIEATLIDPAAPRLLKPGRAAVAPKLTVKDLPNAYPTLITINRATFKLRLYKRLKLRKTYGVAVGQPAYPTPRGRFSITSKQVNPTWTAPNSPWAGEMAGQQVAGGTASNPLKARWMGLAGGVGIHGTGQPQTIGSRASHGCIRMTVPAVVDLFRRVGIGTPVQIF